MYIKQSKKQTPVEPVEAPVAAVKPQWVGPQSATPENDPALRAYRMVTGK